MLWIQELKSWDGGATLGRSQGGEFTLPECETSVSKYGWAVTVFETVEEEGGQPPVAQWWGVIFFYSPLAVSTYIYVVSVCKFWLLPILEPLEVLKSSKMGPHLVLILLKNPLFFGYENVLTTSPQNKISFMEALWFTRAINVACVFVLPPNIKFWYIFHWMLSYLDTQKIEVWQNTSTFVPWTPPHLAK